MPWQMFAAGDPNLQNATDAFQKLMAAWKDLPEALTREGEKPGSDRITAELLQKIFDPREWMSATGFMDDTVRRLYEQGADSPCLPAICRGRFQRGAVNLDVLQRYRFGAGHHRRNFGLHLRGGG